MRKIKIITDSCSDLSSELLDRYGIDYAKMSTVQNGVESEADLRWTNEDAHSLYEYMRVGGRVTTAQVGTEEFQRIFKEYINDGYDIIYIGCSLKQSGSVNTGHMVASKILENNPDARIACIDSMNASLGEGMLAIEGAKLVDKGCTFDQIVDSLLATRKKINQYVTVHSLTTLKKAGRVKGPAAFFGNLMGVKPILISDANGDQAAYKKVKGRQGSFDEIVAMLKSSIIDAENQTVYVAHADCSKDEIDILVNKIKEEISPRGIYVGYIGPIIGASIGPDAVGIWGFGKEITFKIGDTK